MTTPQTIRAKSDTRSLLSALSKTFTNSTTFIGELLQNARRAKATRIEVTIADDYFEIADNGIGIADFSKLLSIAISGWGADVQQEDQPYGLGFLSVVYAAARLEVVSLGTRFTATREQILGLENVGLEPLGNPTIGTTIRMSEVGMTADVLSHALGRFARGFPVPIIANGEEMLRSHSPDVLELVDTPYGKATPDVVIGHEVGAFYLQGLPIRMHPSMHASRGVVHLDPLQYSGRLPDRNELCQADAARARFVKQWRETAIRTLLEIAGTMDEQEFVTKYGERLDSLERGESTRTLNRFNHLPKTWVKTYTESPRKREVCDENGMKWPTSAVSRETIKSQGAYQIGWSEASPMDSELIAEHVLFANNKRVVIANPKGHWINQERVMLHVDKIELVKGEVIATETTQIHYADVDVVLVKTLEARLTTPVKGLPEITPIPFHYKEETGELFVSEAHADDTYGIIYQVSDFMDGDSDAWDEDAEIESQSRVESTIRALRHNDPASLLDAVLRSGLPWRVPEMLKQNRFQVVFDHNGSFAIEAEPVK